MGTSHRRIHLHLEGSQTYPRLLPGLSTEKRMKFRVNSDENGKPGMFLGREISGVLIFS